MLRLVRSSEPVLLDEENEDVADDVQHVEDAEQESDRRVLRLVAGLASSQLRLPKKTFTWLTTWMAIKTTNSQKNLLPL